EAHLGDGMLKPREVAAWLEQRAEEQGPRWRREPPRRLWFSIYGKGKKSIGSDCVLVTGPGVLEGLQLIARDLERRFGWLHELAVEFVLTGTSPGALTWVRENAAHAFDFITIRARPCAKPDEVRAAFLAARRELQLERPIDARSAALAAFVHEANDGRS